MGFTSLGTLLPKRLQQAGLDRAVEATRVLFLADALLDEWFGRGTTASRAKAVSVKQKKLAIASLDASLRYQLRLRERELVSVINERSGKPMIDGLRILV